MNLKMIGTVGALSLSMNVIAEDWGYISHDHYECKNDHMAISTDRGWLLAEAYSPYSALREGYYISGDLTGYGFEDVLSFSSKYDDSPEEARIYIDNYWMSDADAARYCFAGEDMQAVKYFLHYTGEPHMFILYESL